MKFEEKGFQYKNVAQASIRFLHECFADFRVTGYNYFDNHEAQRFGHGGTTNSKFVTIAELFGHEDSVEREEFPGSVPSR